MGVSQRGGGGETYCMVARFGSGDCVHTPLPHEVRLEHAHPPVAPPATHNSARTTVDTGTSKSDLSGAGDTPVSTHARKHTHVHKYSLSHKYTNTHSLKPSIPHSNTQTHTLTHTYTYTHLHIHTQTHTHHTLCHTHSVTHTLSHTHTHAHVFGSPHLHRVHVAAPPVLNRPLTQIWSCGLATSVPGTHEKPALHD